MEMPPIVAPDLWDDDAFKRRVHALCQHGGITVERLLAESGLSRQYLRKVRSRRTNHIAKMAHLLGVTPHYLAFGETRIPLH